VALLKAGKDPNAAKSYRPVALTSHVAKLVERLVRTRLMHVIERWGLLRPEQAGYRTLRSTTEQLTLVTQLVADAMDAGETTLMLAVDFTAAFDRARRQRLYGKMLDKGLPPHVVRWVRAFLTQRTARVRVGGERSSWREFVEGFPQGTVLGPVLWDLFLDDLVEELRRGAPAGVEVEVVLYADDVTVLLRGRNRGAVYRQAQCALDRLAAWEEENEARGSLDKTTTTVFIPRPGRGDSRIPEADRPQL